MKAVYIVYLVDARIGEQHLGISAGMMDGTTFTILFFVIVFVGAVAGYVSFSQSGMTWKARCGEFNNGLRTLSGIM